MFDPIITWDGNINYDNLSLLLINKDNGWSSCLNFPFTLDCEIPQYLEVFTFQYSLPLLFMPAIISFQSTFTTKLPADVPCHVIMPSFIFCLRQLTALTHLMGHRFSLTSANSAHRGILLCDQYEISYNLFSKLVPGRYISDILYHIRYSNSMV